MLIKFYGISLLLVINYVMCQEPLKFTVSTFPGSRRTAHYKDNVTISCQTNDPYAVVKLKFSELQNQKVIQNGQNFSIYNVNLHNSGKCVCHAENKNEKISLVLGRIFVSTTQCKVTPVVGRKVRTFEKNDNFSIVCFASGHQGSKALTWKKDDILVSNAVYTHAYSSGRDYNVARLNVLLANKKTAGTYSCVRRVSTCTADTATSTSVHLKYIVPFVPEFKLTMIQYSYLIQTSVTITCETEASPMPSMKWTRAGNVITRCSSTKSCKLVLKDLEESSGGEYICIAENSQGVSQSKHVLKVLVPPEVKEGMYDEKRDRSLKCEVTRGNPTPFVFWQKAVPCAQDANRSCEWRNLSTGSFKLANPSQSVSIVTFPDEGEHGTFRCVASNVAGNGTTQMVLRPKPKGKQAFSMGMIAGITGALVFLVVICVLTMYCYKTHLKKTYALYMGPDPNFILDPHRTLFEQSIELPYDPEWEFPRERLKKIRNLGAGAFGQVYLAHASGILALKPRDKDTAAIHRRTRLRMNKRVPKKLFQCLFDDDSFEESIFVAVKTLKDNPTDIEYKDLASEIKVLIHLGNHENIVNVLGACTRGGNICAIMEYCPYGNLVNFLRDRRSVFSMQWAKQANCYDDDFCFLDASYFALQIARGMTFLSQKKVVHRDLAARNILVGADHVIKIADFGLARDIYATDFYFKESSGMLPVKWMAPESLFDKLYTVKSDVWSFGIVLWEICTMGGSPYPGLPMENLFEYLQAGNRMDQPGTCPSELYEIMRQCWHNDMNSRPYFNELVSQFKRIVDSKTVITNNLATFERFMSSSSETDYLVPASPAKRKKGSLDTLLAFRSFPPATPRKKSVDVLINFPPVNDDDMMKTENNNKLKVDVSPVNDNRYVDLVKLQQTKVEIDTGTDEYPDVFGV